MQGYLGCGAQMACWGPVLLQGVEQINGVERDAGNSERSQPLGTQ